MDAPRDNLIRCTPFILPEGEARDLIRADDEGKRLVGYPIVFDTWTEINSWEGKFREQISSGALNKTLKENRDNVLVLFNHGFEFSTGDKPIAIPDVLNPDERGLWTESDWVERPYADDIRHLIEQKAIKGQSFRFSVVKDLWDDEPEDDGLPTRTILELKLFEFGPVTYPAYKATTVGVRSAAQYQEWLRNEAPDEADPTSDEAEVTSEEQTDEPREALIATSVASIDTKRMSRDLEVMDSYLEAIVRRAERYAECQ